MAEATASKYVADASKNNIEYYKPHQVACNIPRYFKRGGTFMISLYRFPSLPSPDSLVKSPRREHQQATVPLLTLSGE